MLMRLKSHLLFSKVLLGCYPNGFSNLFFGSQILRGFNETAKHGFSAMSSDNLRSLPKSDSLRNYQVVVAATREMGIGKDGSNIPTGENVVTCGSISSALELLADVPYCFSIETVFVIGGGQIFRETLNAPGCEAIHITEIETSVECDTFIPAIDLSCFQLWYSSKPLVENDVRFSFATYVRVRSGATGSPSNSEIKSNGSSNSNNFVVKDLNFLPRMILERHDGLITKCNWDLRKKLSQLASTITGSIQEFSCQVSFKL